MNNFIPEFSRVIWSNKADKWPTIFQEVSIFWQAFEKLSVETGYRNACLVNINPSELVKAQDEWKRHNCVVKILGATNSSENYSSGVGTVDYNKPFAFRCLIHRFNTFPESGMSEDMSIGRILSYPDCCITAFEKYWNKEKYIDTVWPAYQASKKIVFTSNIFLRYLGIRPIFHLPCTMDCVGTQVTGIRNIQEFSKHFPAQAGYLREILQWPLEWSNLNGIVEVKFPLGKIMAKGDYFYESKKQVIKYEGTKYPAEGESGVVFPYTRKKELSKTSFIELRNGFVNDREQNRAHEWIADLLATYGIHKGHFVDLGAGNGDLIHYIERVYPGLIGMGVDSEFSSHKVQKMNIMSFAHGEGDRYELALIAEQRFFDTYEDRDRALDHIKTFAEKALVYNYSTRKAQLISLEN